METKTKQQMLSELMKVETKIGGYRGLRFLKSRPVVQVREIYDEAVELGILKEGKK